MAKYVKALDYMVCATQAYRRGNMKLAAKLLKAAAAHPSRVMATRIVDKINTPAVAAVKKTRTRAAAEWPFRVRSESEIIAPDSLDEFGLEPNVQDFREVQEAELEDELAIESSDLEGDEGFGQEDLDTLAAEFDDEFAVDSTDLEGDDTQIEASEEDLDEEEAVEQARFIRALRNQRAARAARAAASAKATTMQKKGRLHR